MLMSHRRPAASHAGLLLFPHAAIYIVGEHVMRRGRKGDIQATLVTLLAIGLIASLDYLTGHEISFSAFYLIPVGLLAWRTTLPLALLAAVVAAALWLAADMTGHVYSHSLIGWWNALVRLSIFVFGAVTLSRLRGLLDLERTLARTDSLTGVSNARAFTEALEAELLRSKRTARPFSLVFLDLDQFKSLNDRFGHAAGDEVLRQVGGLLARCVRANDIVGRMGGDEFAVLLTETDRDQARSALERIHRELRTTLQAMPWSPEIQVTASLGAVMHPGGADAASADLLQQADALMYEAKQRGRDRLVLR